MSKYIKLEDAIERRNELYHSYEVEEWLKSLPTIEVSEDCISRKWVLNEIITKVENDDSLTDEQKDSLSAAKYLIRHAPPVVPKRPEGEWIDCQEYGYVECPFCGHATNCEDNKDELHFCFYCGAKMKGADDEA